MMLVQRLKKAQNMRIATQKLTDGNGRLVVL